jgi:GMP synthase (glutamine-hydrolysing)
VRVLAISHQHDAGPGVFAEAISAAGAELDNWLPPLHPEPPADPLRYDAVLVLGGSVHPDQDAANGWLGAERELLQRLLASEVPLLGLCLGGQLVAAAAGATPRRAARPEIGWHRVELSAAAAADPLLAPLAPGFEAFQWHSYEFPLPPGAVALAHSDVCLQACRIGERAWAMQFHPEVSATDAGAWIDDYRADEDAVRIGIDPVALGAETAAKIGAFDQLGRELCGRWLEQARRR